LPGAARRKITAGDQLRAWRDQFFGGKKKDGEKKDERKKDEKKPSSAALNAANEKKELERICMSCGVSKFVACKIASIYLRR